MMRWAQPALVVGLLVLGSLPASAESNEDVPLRFSLVEGEDHLPPGCLSFQYQPHDGPRNPCHAIATSMNGLDAPTIDVLILLPVSPFAERDLRIMRQSVQMWEDGLQWMAADMGLAWLAEGIEFRISTQVIENPGTFTDYAILDPEIVVVASNPVGGLGIGFDPQWLAAEVFGDERLREGPCHGIKQPFVMEAWRALPGFDAHHGARSGTSVEDCDGAGGNICFSVNTAIDPYTDAVDVFQLYDLVSHETGHCLTLGHVGDGAEGSWDTTPVNDIMAYSSGVLMRSKCVSSLDVEGFAVTMSKYLDVDGNGTVDDDDRLWANDAEGAGDFRPFQMQQPGNHYYASPTRAAEDCPQPDMSFEPLKEVRDFTPDAPPRSHLAIQGISDGSRVAQGVVSITGLVEGEVPPHILQRPLPVPEIVLEDPAGDSAVPHFDIHSVAATVTDESLTVIIAYADLRPDEGKTVAPQYALGVGEATFYAWNHSPYVTWDLPERTITFTLPRDRMAAGINDNLGSNHTLNAPYEVRAWVYSAPGHGDANFDYAPALGDPALLLGPVTVPADAPYVLVQAPGQNVTVPIQSDGTWVADIDLSALAAGTPVNITATWMTPTGHAIDSDHLGVVPDPDVLAQHGLADRESTPAPGLMLVAAALVFMAAMIERRRTR